MAVCTRPLDELLRLPTVPADLPEDLAKLPDHLSQGDRKLADLVAAVDVQRLRQVAPGDALGELDARQQRPHDAADDDRAGARAEAIVTIAVSRAMPSVQCEALA